MPITVPDSSWYRAKSAEAGVACSCPYTNVHKCYRYYASIYMLGEVKMITSISNPKKIELDQFWERSGLAPVIEEEDTGVSGSEGRSSSFSNFCPEVTYKYFRYYASYLSRYVDEIDKDCGQRIAEREKIKKDWRYEWQFLTACHFLECSAYNQVDDFNTKGIGKFDRLAHSNVVVLIGRMENCLESNDPSGVLHAASNILETMAKDVLGDKNLANQTLGSFYMKHQSPKDHSTPLASHSL